MAITDYAAYKDMKAVPDTVINFAKNHNATIASRMFSLWATSPDPGTAPTTAAALTSATAGSLPAWRRATAGDRRLVGAQIAGSIMGGSAAGTLILCDRLSHQGGLSGTTTTEQTTNLPTAALPRFTSGDGVFIALEIYTAIGATATTVSASYTNQAGTAGRTTPLTDFGGTGFNTASRFIVLPLQEGDTGAKSVESVTVTATTGTAGNFGVTLFKPLLPLCVYPAFGRTQEIDPLLGMAANIPAHEDDTCFFWVHISSTTTSGAMNISLSFAEDR